MDRRIDMEPISLKQYGVQNSARDIHDILKAWVNWEEKAWYKHEPAPLPKFQPGPKVKFSAGLYNFLRQLLP